MSPEGFVLMAEMFANNEINLEAILEEVQRGMRTYRATLREGPNAYWCEDCSTDLVPPGATVYAGVGLSCLTCRYEQRT
jgi:hypothetical protein